MVVDVQTRLRARAMSAGLEIPDDLGRQLSAYYDLLQHWNRTINLTGLPDSDDAIVRLIIEPLVAARHLPQEAHLMDLGSGGGSPAIPMALGLRAQRLVMVEPRARKAAFLREAVRQLQLSWARIEQARVEDLAVWRAFQGEMTVISVRAVRLDSGILAAMMSFLKPGGFAAFFQTASTSPPEPIPGLSFVTEVPLLSGPHSRLQLWARA